MSAVTDTPIPRLESGASADAPLPTSVPFHYVQTDSFVALLTELGASLVVSTYQANKLLVARAQGSGLSMLVRTFERPMGLAVDDHRLTIGTRKEIWFLRNAPDIAPQVEPVGQHDACFLPRSSHVTGDIGVHEIVWARIQRSEVGGQGSEARGQGSDADSEVPTSDLCHLTSPSQETSDLGRLVTSSPELWLVNTRFSCLCTLHPDYSFVPRWRPPFITALAAEDRCHLNGLALLEGRPKYVTALGETDIEGGWRAKKSQAGCLIDVPSNEIMMRGLSMPHSPRWHAGRLWLLESGTGRLGCVDAAAGRFEGVAEVPGFARGLALCGHYAFVGLSKIRPTSAMDGVPLAERREQLKCGIAAVDLRSGQTVAFLEFQTAVEEIFDVQLLSGIRFPEVIGFQKETVHHTFIIPSEDRAPTRS